MCFKWKLRWCYINCTTEYVHESLCSKLAIPVYSARRAVALSLSFSTVPDDLTNWRCLKKKMSLNTIWMIRKDYNESHEWNTLRTVNRKIWSHLSHFHQSKLLVDSAVMMMTMIMMMMMMMTIMMTMMMMIIMMMMMMMMMKMTMMCALGIKGAWDKCT